MEDKRRTYLGFAKRAGKLTLGVNAVKASKSKIYLLIADMGVSSNTKKEIERLQKRMGCPLVFVEDLEELTGKDFCKLAAVTEEHLAEAARKEIEKRNSSGDTEGTYGI